MSARVDVRAVLAMAQACMDDEHHEAEIADLVAARAVVAELIEAQRKAHDAMLLADWNVPGLCSERQHAAYCASAAALARIGGAA